MSAEQIKQNILKKKEELKESINTAAPKQDKKRKLDDTIIVSTETISATEIEKTESDVKKHKKQKLDISYNPAIYCPWKIVEMKKEYLMIENDKKEKYGYPLIQRLRKRLRQNNKIPCLVITKKEFPYLRQKIEDYLKVNSGITKQSRVVIYNVSDIDRIEHSYQDKLKKILSEANE
jgi:hypothetical protein